MKASFFAPPELSLRWVAVWRRNYLVWQRLAIPSILGNLADPLIMLFGLGYGLGALLGEMGGTSYFGFLAAGLAASATMRRMHTPAAKALVAAHAHSPASTSSSVMGALTIASHVRCTCMRENAEYIASKLAVNIALWQTMPVPMNAM